MAINILQVQDRINGFIVYAHYSICCNPKAKGDTAKNMQLVLRVIYFTTEIHFCNYFYRSVMYNNKQDFVPPLVNYR